jgi:thiamine biosynthesis lipoprotein
MDGDSHSPKHHRLSPQAAAPGVGWIERAQPLLGTLVRIGLRGLGDAAAHEAIDRAFAAVARTHRLMSFHEPDSDLGRLNRLAGGTSARGGSPVRVDPWTAEVLRLALELAEASDGVFDITSAPRLVEWGYLPRPTGAPAPDPGATWCDIEFTAADEVRFRKPLWIDLGGIAKGWAVDAALRALRPAPGIGCRVNAGGDLRVAGPQTERVLLQVPGHPADRLPVIELRDAALASSTGLASRRGDGERQVGPHVDGRSRDPAPTDRFVSVVAPRCALADALTKVVLVRGAGAAAVLAALGAAAHLYDAGAHAWLPIGEPS